MFQLSNSFLFAERDESLDKNRPVFISNNQTNKFVYYCFKPGNQFHLGIKNTTFQFFDRCQKAFPYM